MKYFFSLLTFLYVSTTAIAQCKDSTLIQPGAFCGTLYDPVCGCDGITYKNFCYANKFAGVAQFNAGVCGAVDFDFNPNPVIDVIYLNYYVTNPGYLRVQIIDRFGKVYYNGFYQNVLSGQVQQLNLDINEVPYGFCFILLQTKDGAKVKPFVKFRA